MKRNNWMTIPNLLSMVRLALIPVIVYLYRIRGDHMAALGMLVLSGVTDVADGFIARKFHMVSDLGKILDPVADKLTQLVTLLCLCGRFPHLGVLAALLVAKEVTGGFVSLWAVRKAGTVPSSAWHGKAATVALYGVMGLHMLWPAIPGGLTDALVLLCMALMALSAALYMGRNWQMAQKFSQS